MLNSVVTYTVIYIVNIVYHKYMYWYINYCVFRCVQIKFESENPTVVFRYSKPEPPKETAEGETTIQYNNTICSIPV